MSTEKAVALPQGITAVVEHGMDALRVETAAARGLVFLHGAHVTHWAPAGHDEVLWLSEHAVFKPGKAIRGGVPICFPWFGPGRDGASTPAHGFARTSTWRLADATMDEDGSAIITLELTGSDVDDLAGFPDDFTARLRVTMGAELRLALQVTAGQRALDVEEALHTYLTVADVRETQVIGLEGARYLDKVSGSDEVQDGPVNFTTETDRIYWTSAPTIVEDRAGGRRVEVSTQSSHNTVVWNPWVDKAAAMGDFGDAEWPTMCCVETANVLDNAVALAPGEQHELVAVLRPSR